MLPFVIGGGILIALSFICDGANAGTDVFGNGTALAKFFNTVGNTAFGMMFPILAGYIAMAIGERPALMPGIVGGLLAKAGTSIFLPEDQWVSSGFFGALIAGFVAGYLMVLIKKLLENFIMHLGDKTGSAVSVFGDRSNGSNHDLYCKSTDGSIQYMA